MDHFDTIINADIISSFRTLVRMRNTMIKRSHNISYSVMDGMETRYSRALNNLCAMGYWRIIVKVVAEERCY